MNFPHIRPFCDFSPTLSATFKRFIYNTVIHTSRPYRIDRGELSRYTTPYLNSYGLVGPFIPRPTLYVSLLSCYSMDEQARITYHSSSFIACFPLYWATSNTLFYSLHCHYHRHISRHPSHNLLASSQFLHPNNFGITSLHLIHSYPPPFLRHLDWA